MTAAPGFLDHRPLSRAARRFAEMRNLDVWHARLDVSDAKLCGSTLARAHARSGDRVAIASYLGSGDALDRALADFAEAYADHPRRDRRLTPPEATCAA